MAPGAAGAGSERPPVGPVGPLSEKPAPGRDGFQLEEFSVSRSKDVSEGYVLPSLSLKNGDMVFPCFSFLCFVVPHTVFPSFCLFFNVLLKFNGVV